MLIGIDVGGTFTDAVAVDNGRVVAQSKIPTKHANLMAGILLALEAVLEDVGEGVIERVALSTTIVTNAIIEGRIDPVGLLVMTGPGLDLAGLTPVVPYELSGYVDHRGCQVADIVQAQVLEACRSLSDCAVFAVSGKFSVRNPGPEQQVANWIRERCNPLHITVGAGLVGDLNFVRRTNSAYYNAAVWRSFDGFAGAIQAALACRNISAPVYVLKADGGTMPLQVAQQRPVEAIFTGPAASVLGIMALESFRMPAISLDIGGTTTDIALWQDGVPLMAQRGAIVKGYPTAVRSFRLHSVGIGGDSYVRRSGTVWQVGPERRGPAMALGGNDPTVTDAMIVAGNVLFGNRDKAVTALESLALPGESLQDVAQSVLDAAAEAICKTVYQMLAEHAAEPVYRVADIVNASDFAPELVVGVGGAASGLAPLVAARLGITSCLPQGGMVANAIGAAVARPTIEISLRADTERGEYTVSEMGLAEKLPPGVRCLTDVIALAEEHLRQRALGMGIPVAAVELLQQEEFNLIRGFRTTGKIISCRLQVKPGVLAQGKYSDNTGVVL